MLGRLNMNKIALLLVVVVAAVAAVLFRGWDKPWAEAGASQAGAPWDWVWVTDRHQESFGQAVIADSAGAYMLGWFSAGLGSLSDPAQPIYVGPHRFDVIGRHNFFVARFNRRGELLWVQRHGDGGSVYGADMARNPKGGLVVAGTLGLDGPGRLTVEGQTYEATGATGFVAWLSDSGALQRVRLVAEAGTIDGVAVDGAGNVYVAGATGSHGVAPPPLNRPGSAAVWAFTPDGEPLWSTTVAVGGTAVAGDVAVGGRGLCVSGYVRPTASNAFTLGGEVREQSGAAARAGVGFVVRLGLNGSTEWAFAPRLDSAALVHLKRTAADSTGNCYAAGAFAGRVVLGSDTLRAEQDGPPPPGGAGHKDAVVVKLGPNGVEWTVRGIGGPASDFFEDLTVSIDGRVYATGSFMGETRLGGSALGRAFGRGFNPRALSYVEVSDDGTVLRAVSNAPTVYTKPTGISSSDDGSVYVVGQLGGDAEFGGTLVRSRGGNAFVARLVSQ